MDNSIYDLAQAVYTADMKICWAQYLQWAVFAVLALAILLSGCGQTGPLVLPGKAAQASQPTPTQSPKP